MDHMVLAFLYGDAAAQLNLVLPQRIIDGAVFMLALAIHVGDDELAWSWGRWLDVLVEMRGGVPA